MQENGLEAARKAFLADAGWADSGIEPLPPDASFRRYFRVRDGARTALLMDAPPGRENVLPFVQIAQHLAGLGLHPPRVFADDVTAGFVLLEDFGDDTYSRLLTRGESERKLYALAVDVLIALHTHPQAASIDVPPYDTARLLQEAVLLVDWFYPEVRGESSSDGVRRAYLDAWHEVLESLPAIPSTLVLRDYHVDNLMRVHADGGAANCGLLDFQDAVIGSPAYDLMSLLEDARRDVPAALAREMLQRYHRTVPAKDLHAFEMHYRVLAAQRHCKVAGIFVRLCRRDRKCEYLAHIPRVIALLQRHLSEPALQPLQRWLDEQLPMRHDAGIAVP